VYRQAQPATNLIAKIRKWLRMGKKRLTTPSASPREDVHQQGYDGDDGYHDRYNRDG
jgi:hypothetical protein